MTNGDRIRQMSNEELVGRLGCDSCIYYEVMLCDRDCTEGIKAYLESEVEKGEMKNESYDKSTNAR